MIKQFAILSMVLSIYLLFTLFYISLSTLVYVQSLLNTYFVFY